MRWLVLLSIPLSAGGCILDWERDSSVGGSGSAGSGGEAGAGGSVVGCEPAGSCVCESTLGFVISCVCASGNCSLDCGTTATCELSCPGGGGEMSCTASSVCKLNNCSDCSLDCGSLSCCFEDGESKCLPVSACTPC